jgi:hypothetical protein
VVGVRKADPATAGLRKEFDARGTAWLIVLDARGELLEAGYADRTGAFKKKETAEKFADPFLDRVEKSLLRKESLQDLERRWIQDPKDEPTFAALASRLEEMAAFTRLREFCERAAAIPGLPAGYRADALLRAFAARPREFNSPPGTREGKERIVQEGERLIAEHASHPRCPDAVKALFTLGYSGRFDVPARSAAGMARLEAVAKALKDPNPLRDRIAELSQLRDEEIARLQAAREAAKGNEAAEGGAAAALGDAEATIRIFSGPAYERSAFHQVLVDEAREKLKRQR